MNKKQELWFVTGSQHLYGPETLAQVAADAQQVAEALNAESVIPIDVVWKPTVKTPDEVYAMCRDANADEHCIGLITWMHTFSPAKMWIAGLTELKKPFVHLHTQFGRDIPWSEIDMETRFRVVLNEVEAVVPEHELPKLPVARVLGLPQPNLEVGAAAWILAGGAHHSVYSQQVDTRHIEIFCEMANVELVVIDADTRLLEFERILKAGD